jgi:transcription initiation factor TFIIIB Brf1 subunit/transcription initiation factor TFIIB
MSFWKSGCPDCGGYAFVDVYSDGDTICTQCGLVVQERIIVDDYFYNLRSFEDHEEIATEPTIAYNKDVDKKFKAINEHMLLPSSILQIAGDIFNTIREKQRFKGQVLDNVIACSFYIAMQQHGVQGVSRSVREMCNALGLDMSVFTKTLKVIYDICPQFNNPTKNASVSIDNLYRQIQSINVIPNDRIWDIKKEVHILDNVRIKRCVLMGSPPSVVNSILIFVACQKLGITLDKKQYIIEANICKATLDKHIRRIQDLI